MFRSNCRPRKPGKNRSDLRFGGARSSVITQAAQYNLAGEQYLDIDIKQLSILINHQTDKIEQAVAGTGFLPETVIGVGTFLLDNQGDFDLLTAIQHVTFARFLKPLLDASD